MVASWSVRPYLAKSTGFRRHTENSICFFPGGNLLRSFWPSVSWAWSRPGCPQEQRNWCIAIVLVPVLQLLYNTVGRPFRGGLAHPAIPRISRFLERDRKDTQQPPGSRVLEQVFVATSASRPVFRIHVMPETNTWPTTSSVFAKFWAFRRMLHPEGARRADSFLAEANLFGTSDDRFEGVLTSLCPLPPGRASCPRILFRVADSNCHKALGAPFLSAKSSIRTAARRLKRHFRPYCRCAWYSLGDPACLKFRSSILTHCLGALRLMLATEGPSCCRPRYLFEMARANAEIYSDSDEHPEIQWKGDGHDAIVETY